MTRTRRGASVFILGVLVLQVVPVARELTGERETLWPFLAWGMFRHSSRPPIEAVRRRVLAVTPAGERIVGPADAGFDRFAFRRYYQVPLAEGDAAAARDLAARVEGRWNVAVQAIVAEQTVFAVGPSGVRPRASSRRVFLAPVRGPGRDP